MVLLDEEMLRVSSFENIIDDLFGSGGCKMSETFNSCSVDGRL